MLKTVNPNPNSLTTLSDKKHEDAVYKIVENIFHVFQGLV